MVCSALGSAKFFAKSGLFFAKSGMVSAIMSSYGGGGISSPYGGGSGTGRGGGGAYRAPLAICK